MIYELRVNLRHTNEAVWRKIEIDSNVTFNELSEILQAIFDWDGFRMHRFSISKSYGKRVKNVIIKPNLSMKYNALPVKKSKEQLDERTVKISDWLGNIKDRALYSYNIENDNENEIIWEHEIILEKIIHPEMGVLYPYCTGAKNLVPKESTNRELSEEQLTKTLAGGKKLVKDINELLQERLSHVISEVPDQGNHLWVQLLKRTKDFYRISPWESLSKNDIFVVVDPVTKEWLLCSVLGAEQEPCGLAVYIGKQGLEAMWKHLQGDNDEYGRHMHPHYLELLFDDRQALSQQDHALIKTNDIPFRGKKAWPQFKSCSSGRCSALRQEEEARLLHIAIEQAIHIGENAAYLAEMPNIFFGDKNILARVPVKSGDTVTFINDLLDVSSFMDDTKIKKVSVELDETEVKKIQDIKKRTFATIEFAWLPINDSGMNEQENYPIFAVGANQNDGHVYYQHLLSEPLNKMAESTVKSCQEEFGFMLKGMEALPHQVATDAKTAKLIEPLAEKLRISIIVQKTLPIASMLIQELFTEKKVR